MKWPDPFGRRAQRRVLDVLDELGGTVERVDIRLQELTKHSACLNDDADPSIQLRQTHATLDGMRKGILGLSIATLVLLLGGTMVTVWALAGFADPSPDFPKYGSVQIFIEQDGGEPSNPSDASLQVLYYPEYRQSATYTFSVPKQLVGRRFVIVLETSATLRDLAANFTITWSLDSKGCPRKDDHYYLAGHGKFRRCQLIAGVVPEATEGGMAGMCSTGLDASDLVQLQVEGNGRFESHSDWAHRQIEVPNTLLGWNSQPVESWGGYDLGGAYSTPQLRSCAIVTMRENHSLASLGQITVAPVEKYGSAYFWETSAASAGAVITTRSTYASGIASIVVASGATVAAVGVGFVPVLYQKGSLYLTERKKKLTQ